MAGGEDPLMTLLGQQQQPQQTPMLPQQGVLPQTNPVQAQPQGDPTAMMQQMGRQFQMPAMQGEMNVAQQMGPLTQGEDVPRQGYAPKFQPMNSAGNVLGDVGKALLLGLSATGPGQAVSQAYYQNKKGGVKEYEAGQAQKAQRIEAMKTQAGAYGEVSGSASRAISGLAEADYRNRQASSKETQEKINQQKADQDAQRITNNYVIQGQRLAQGWDRLEQGQQNIAIKEWFDKGVLQAMKARTDAGMDQNSARIQAQEDMKAAATQSGFDTKYPILGPLMRSFGVGPDLTSAPAAGVPKPVSQPPKRAGKSASGGGMIRARDPQGKLHEAPAGTALPQGWKKE